MLKVIDMRLIYGFANIFVIPPTLVFSAASRRTIYRYLRHRQNFGRWKSAWLTYRNFCDFAQVVIDRFAMYAGKKFTIEFDGYENWQRLAAGEQGFIQLSSHIGNYELAGYSLRAEEKRFNAMVFAGEKATVMANRMKMFEGNNIRMVPMTADMSHLFTIDNAISGGEIVSMPADRVFGSQKAFTIPFLGADAKFPQGPFTLASLRDVPTVFVAVMKTASKRYRTIIRVITVSESLTGKKRAEAIARRYVDELEKIVREYPTQWYNYFYFWTK